MANTKWSIPDAIAITKWSIQGSGQRCKLRASNGAMTAARNSQVFLRFADGLHVFQKRAFRRARKKSRDERSTPQSQPLEPEMFGTKTPRTFGTTNIQPFRWFPPRLPPLILPLLDSSGSVLCLPQSSRMLMRGTT